MRYTYDLHASAVIDAAESVTRTRVSTTTNFDEIEHDWHQYPDKFKYINVYDNTKKDLGPIQLYSDDDLEGFRIALERSTAWKPERKPWRPFENLLEDATAHLPHGTIVDKTTPINPSHYQYYCQDLQWLETMQYLPDFRAPGFFEAALKLQVRKYLDRCGQKDAEAQELKKAIWYLKFLTAYIINGGPIRVKDIPVILSH